MRRTLKAASDDDILGRSAQLSYYLFLALFPMLVAIISVMSVFGHADYTRQIILEFLAVVLPESASQLIQNTVTEVIQSAGGLKLSFGIIFSLWSPSAGMSAIMDTLNAEYEVPEGRSFIRKTGTAIGLLIACAVLLVTAMVIVLMGGSTTQVLSPSLLVRIALWAVAFVLVLLAFALIYYLAPDVKISNGIGLRLAA